MKAVKMDTHLVKKLPSIYAVTDENGASYLPISDFVHTLLTHLSDESFKEVCFWVRIL